MVAANNMKLSKGGKIAKIVKTTFQAKTLHDLGTVVTPASSIYMYIYGYVLWNLRLLLCD